MEPGDIVSREGTVLVVVWKKDAFGTPTKLRPVISPSANSDFLVQGGVKNAPEFWVMQD
jgi:hypothetical protein